MRPSDGAARHGARSDALKVFAIVVCYHPNVARLRDMCASLTQSDVRVILVDNSEQSILHDAADLTDCITIVNADNLGIARAQNIGIRRAVQCGAEAVVFFDQDSRINQGLVSSLVAHLTPGVPAVVAPVYYDEVKGFEYPSLKLNRLGFLRKVYAGGRVGLCEVDVVISSGTATTIETFQRAGMMDEDFFIDAVDTEWCLRCRRNQVPITVVPSATMHHSIGNRSIDLGVATVLVHSPVRCYYQIRNCFRLFSRDSVPLPLAVREAVGLAIHKLLLLLFVRGRVTYLKFFAEAIYDGLRGVTGKKPLRG